MFKKVEYIDFEDHPELKALAERATAVLAQEIDDWQDRVELNWRRDYNPNVPFSVKITLHYGPLSTNVYWSMLAEDFRDHESLQFRCRSIWRSVLLTYLDNQRHFDEVINRQPVEVQ